MATMRGDPFAPCATCARLLGAPGAGPTHFEISDHQAGRLASSSRASLVRTESGCGTENVAEYGLSGVDAATRPYPAEQIQSLTRTPCRIGICSSDRAICQ